MSGSTGNCLVAVVLVFVGDCTNCNAFSFLVASKQALVTSLRNSYLDSVEVAINVATSVIYLGTTYEWADVVATSELPCCICGLVSYPSPMKVLVFGDGFDAMVLWVDS